MKVARACLRRQEVPLDEDALHRRLVRAVTADAAAIAGLGDRLGAIAPGRPADLTVLERTFDDPWRSVVEAEPAAVGLVTIDGFLAYGRTEWMQQLAPGPEMEPVLAWGRPMTLDTSFAAAASGQAPVRLRDLRKKLIARYPQTGPIFA